MKVVPPEILDDRCNVAWTRSITEILNDCSVDPSHGLESWEVSERQSLYGRNQLGVVKRRHVVSILADQFRSLVILLLAVAGTLAILFSDYVEGLAIFAVIVINGTIGFLTEWRAIRSMEALEHLGRVDTVVMRDSVVQKISAEELVPGDIVVFEGGDIVTADIRLIEIAKFEVDESTLTGESLPVRKQPDPLPLEIPVMERSNMVFKGTAVTRGSGRGVVVGIGISTELGRISKLVTEAKSQQTPLEKRLDTLGERLAGTVLVVASLIAVAGILAGRDTFLAIEVAIALAIAAIPEGLPIVATIALARGMWRMAKHNALIARLSAVETLGATSVILSDKTGTLTENRMTVTIIQLEGADITVEGAGPTRQVRFCENGLDLEAAKYSLLDELLITGALCNNASLHIMQNGEIQAVGDPTELSLLVAAAQRGLHREKLLEHTPEFAEIPFDPATNLMATLYRNKTEDLVAVKGAPESVILRCSSVRTINGE
jgi:Ca2+-transporting ATPase